MVSPVELLWGVLALQIAALGGIGGLIYTQAKTEERVASHHRRLAKLERKTA